MVKIKDFLKRNYDYVEYRVTLPEYKGDLEDTIFAGCFKIIGGKIISLDGDTYSESEEVIWSEEWSDEKEDIKHGLSVLVKGGWVSK